MKQWGCDFNTISHYISEQGSLRLACKSDVLVTAVLHDNLNLPIGKEISTAFAYKGQELAWTSITLTAIADPPPPILYFRKPKIYYDAHYGPTIQPFPKPVREIEDFNQNVYRLIALSRDTLEALTQPGGKSALTYKNLISQQELELEKLSSSGSDYFITREERDRFERLNNPQAVDPTNQPTSLSIAAKNTTPSGDAAITAITDKENPNYPGELAIAIAAWNYLYRDGNRSEGHSHSRAFDIWAKTHAKELSVTAKGRVRSVCTPNVYKNDGSFRVKKEQ